MECNRKTIWNFAQNKPTYIVRDITEKYPETDSDFDNNANKYLLMISEGD